MFSSSDEHSWKKSRDLLEKVARQGELTGYRVPCLLIAAKDDLTPYPRAVQDSVKVLLHFQCNVTISLNICQWIMHNFIPISQDDQNHHLFIFGIGYSGIGNRGTYSLKYEIR